MRAGELVDARVRRFAAWIVLAASLLSAAVGRADTRSDELVVRLSPDGPVFSLAEAIATVERQYQGQPHVRILVEPGLYQDNTAILELSSPSIRSYTIVAENGAAVFDGSGTVLRTRDFTWLALRGQHGQATNVTIKGLTIRNYRQAILLYGSKHNYERWNGFNTISSNKFERIGLFIDLPIKSYSAIMLINSRNNLISDNTFTDVKNYNYCRGMHSIYLRTYSSWNMIRDNVFNIGCGDPIKFRDSSNYNLVIGNRFESQAGPGLVVDSYCVSKEGACRTVECPSFGNVVENSIVDSAGDGEIVPHLTRTVGPSSLSHCPTPDAVRLQDVGSTAGAPASQAGP
ncbi:NosD domain-containing protein [Kumtagia ephedrae]|uniref:Periplasmic copper-binding protein NosD beta helix domain-containing protein n=1 Tax=Kumtagia ephedrae TaxID=2116701 RepID=A0A2P7SSA1_9HYPH|nr:NosD domain-containing protein [Mesorhizobium ephedrae]PSJ65363.1 hypothetical protein C7I84_03195 [Mesorhizobium ephedrae]